MERGAGLIMGQRSQDLGKPTLLSHVCWSMLRKSWLRSTYQLNSGEQRTSLCEISRAKEDDGHHLNCWSS